MFTPKSWGRKILQFDLRICFKRVERFNHHLSISVSVDALRRLWKAFSFTTGNDQEDRDPIQWILEGSLHGVSGGKDGRDEGSKGWWNTIWTHVFEAVFVNSWDPFLSLCLVGSTWVFFLNLVDVLLVVIGVDGLTCDLGRPWNANLRESYKGIDEHWCDVAMYVWS